MELDSHTLMLNVDKKTSKLTHEYDFRSKRILFRKSGLIEFIRATEPVLFLTGSGLLVAEEGKKRLLPPQNRATPNGSPIIFERISLPTKEV